MDIKLNNNKDVPAGYSLYRLKALDIGLDEMDMTLYNFLPTSLDRGSTKYLGLYVRDKCIGSGLLPV